MKVTDSIQTVRTIRWADPTVRWGLVPTMGYLHEGHLSLVRQAREACERVAVTIYVNPTQFAAGEDLSTYPRALDNDLALLEAAGVDLVFTPSDAVMYPSGFQTIVTVETVTQLLEGASRPTHFAGVATIVAKLFNIIQPHDAFFGQKDYQQTVVLRQMVADLNLNTHIVVCPIVREPDGLAMSSRNVYLAPAQRQAALVVSRAWQAAVAALDTGERNGDAIRAVMRDTIAAERLARLDYVSCADPDTLIELETVTDAAVLSLAAFFDNPEKTTRLIDNHVWKVE